MPSIDTEVVILESSAVLFELLSDWPDATYRKVGRPPLAAERCARTLRPVEMPRKRPRSGVCSCGTCARCRDNDKWNRIFEEKFADPFYYGGIAVRHNSSLAGV